MALGNSSDEIILSDGNSNIVWNLAYGNDENDNSTSLTADDFSMTGWGTKAAPGIDRAGADSTVRFGGDLGYESTTAGDSSAYASNVAAINDAGFLAGLGLETTIYASAGEPSLGSPLDGAYTAQEAAATVQVPMLPWAATALLALGLAGFASRIGRRK